MINWAHCGWFRANYPVQDFTEISGILLNRELMPALIMTYKFLSEIHKSPSQAIGRPAGYSSFTLRMGGWPGQANFPGPSSSFENLPNHTPVLTEPATNFYANASLRTVRFLYVAVPPETNNLIPESEASGNTRCEWTILPSPKNTSTLERSTRMRTLSLPLGTSIGLLVSLLSPGWKLGFRFT